VSAFDLELTVSRDLLTVNGGVEQYLKMIEPQQSPITPTSPTLEIERTDNSSLSLSSTVFGDDLLPGSAEPDSASRIATIETAGVSLPLDSEADTLSSSDSIFSIEPSEKAKSIRSASTDSLGVPLSPGSRGFATSDQPFWQFDVVSIDELDLSDTSSDHAVEPSAPSGLRKAPRRLPLRRDFEFVRQSESVSSMGIHSRESVASTTSSILSSSEAGAEQGHGIWQMKQWQVNAIADSFSNDGETGDVEAALRRLEGEINPVLQQEKASKVDGWIRAMQERLTAETDHDDEYPQFSDEEEEEEGPREEAVDEEVTGSDSWSNLNEDVSVSALSLDVSLPLSGADSEANTPPATIHSGPTSPLRSSDARPALEDVVPLEILQSRVPSRPSTSSGSENPSMSLKLGTPERPRVHRSFILAYRAETLVEHFSMIDRELFMGVKFEELVQDDWMACEEVNVLDWGQFLKDRARWKAESRWPHKTSALAAVRARFNLIASFTLSEIVLTQPSERAVVMGKFIRIAWVSRWPSFRILRPLTTTTTESVLLEQFQHTRSYYRWIAEPVGH
jgi:hypothetical protein